MLTTIISLLGGSIGGLMRLAPELFKMFTDKSDKAHELAMTQLQVELEKQRAQTQVDVAAAQQALQSAAGQMQAFAEAIKGQSQMTGVRWLDGLNQSVRPVLTYWWMGLFTAWKVNEVSHNGLTWTADDWGVLSMILGFWFVDRAIRKNNGT
jgi:hypothetical protein